MGRTILGLCVALVLSATLVASPCVVCFKQPAVKLAHDCCTKKQQAPPQSCGLEFSEFSTPDVPVAKVLAQPAVMPVAAIMIAVEPPAPSAPWTTAEPAYTSPPLFLLDSVFLI